MFDYNKQPKRGQARLLLLSCSNEVPALHCPQEIITIRRTITCPNVNPLSSLKPTEPTVRRSSNQFPFWITLILVSGVPRILGAFLLPNSFGDAYVYTKEAGALSAKLSTGTFSLTDFYGYWLPLYQFTSALVNVFLNNPYYVAKLVSALFGIGVCLLVYEISFHITRHRKASLLAFIIIALNPLHIFTSASAMTDLPSAFFVLGSLYFALRRRWLAAAIFGALAGLTRVDNWMLLVLLPMIQIFEERRVSIPSIVILIFPPLFWFYISWKATGDWLACFVSRKQYMDALLAANPSIASLSLFGIAHNIGNLIVSTDIPVLVACLATMWLVIKRMAASSAVRNSRELRAVASINFYFFAYLSFLLLAYLTHKQPIIFPRYGLLLFALGLPILAWIYLEITRQKPPWARRVLVAIIAICVLDASIEMVGSVGFINKVYAHQAAANYLREHLQPNANSRIFCDDLTVRPESGIPEERFVSSEAAPHDREGFMNYLRQNNVEYLVFIRKEDFTPAKLFPELQNGSGNEWFQPVMHVHKRFLPTDVWIYRVTSDRRTGT